MCDWWCIWPQPESFFNPYIPPTLEKLEKLGLIEDSDGARVIFVEGVDIPLIAVKRDGGYNYFSTDLASLWLVFGYLLDTCDATHMNILNIQILLLFSQISLS
jgi:hypothetical protein